MDNDFFTFGNEATNDDFSHIKFVDNPDIPKCLRSFYSHIAIREYATHSYIYEKKNNNIISDSEFDELCKWLLVNYNWVKPFDINNYLEKESLNAGSGAFVANKVCGLTLQYAESIFKEHNEKKKSKKG